MSEIFSSYDPAAALGSKDAIEAFMADAFETGDAAHIVAALGIVARAKGMTELALKTGLSREQLSRSLSPNGKPTLETILAVMKAFGMELAVNMRGAAG